MVYLDYQSDAPLDRCLFCERDTHKYLRGKATIGHSHGSYRIPFCSLCWHTRLGDDRSKELAMEIGRQVTAEGRTP